MPNTTDASSAPVRLESALVVDNDRIIRAFISKILEKAGLRVETAVDGVNAILVPLLVDQDGKGAEDSTDYRIIVNYSVPLK